MRYNRQILTALFVLTAAHAHAQGFSGSFAPSHFTLTNYNANGAANSALAPNSLTLTGGNNGSFILGATTYTAVAAADSTISVHWAYHSNDSGRLFGDSSFYDPAGYLLNNTFIQLTDVFGNVNQSGDLNFHVTQGESFGFYVSTTDNRKGAATLTLSSFTANPANVTATPEPGTCALFVGLGISGAGFLSRRRKCLRSAA